MMERMIIRITSEAATTWPTSALWDPPRLFQKELPGNRSITVRAVQSCIEIQIEIPLKLFLFIGKEREAMICVGIFNISVPFLCR